MITFRVALFFACLGIVPSDSNAQTQMNDSEILVVQAILAEQPRGAAYARFIDMHLISSPHPSEQVHGYIDGAKRGDTRLFSMVALMIWQGDPGFKRNKAAALLAFSTAINHGSGAGAFFIGETYLQTEAITDDDNAGLLKKSLYWFGKAAAMGTAPAYERAVNVMEWIETMNQGSRSDLMILYNQGFSEGGQSHK